MVITKNDCLNLLSAITKKFEDPRVIEACTTVSNFLQSKNFSYEFSSDCINFFSGSYKDDFFLKYMKYHVINDPSFDKSRVVLMRYSSKNKNIKFLFANGGCVVKKATDVTFYLEADGEQFFVNLL